MPPFGRLETLDEAVREQAYQWRGHLYEVESGLPGPGRLGPVRACFDPDSTTVGQRIEAKSRQLQRAGFKASVATVRRMRVRWISEGLWGLVPRQRSASELGRADPVLVATVREVLGHNERRSRSRGWKSRMRKEVGWRLEEREELGLPGFKMPPPSTFNKLLSALEDKGLRDKNMAQRRSWFSRPAPPFTPTIVLRPGERVLFDSTPVDVLVVLDDGTLARPEMTVALDVATRCVLGMVLRVAGTAAVDAAVLLAQAVTPLVMRPGWGEELRMAHANVPFERLLSVDERLAEAAARPVIVPETVVIDQGRVFISESFLGACESLGISVQPVPPANGPAKGHVERQFGSLNSQLFQFLPGYVGSHVGERGQDAEREACLTLPQLQDIIEEFLITGWHRRKHDGLRHPLLPKQALTPLEMWAALVAVTGHVPLPLSLDDHVELLQTRWHPITDHGIRFDYRTYDDEALNGFRGQDSGVEAKQGQWEVHWNPYDLSRIWVRLPSGFVPVPWIHAGEVALPFTHHTWQHIRRVVKRRDGYEDHEAKLARALDDLLRRVSRLHTQATKAERRVVAKSRANQHLAVPPAALDALGSPGIQFTLAGAGAALDEDDETVPDEDDELLDTDPQPGCPGASVRDDTLQEDPSWL
ncbi:Mu transposase C-terminal domain-containing protein [Streptomyces sp. NPDC056486]|uniref:Mu transposase C-terminal domain-containing protein n=1 Tax=Streptomyces sp. NPDC056486 TaxID=3345835 RepID=UPI00369291E5